MIKIFRVAALAAATALLCPATAFAGEREPAAIIAESAAAPIALADAAVPAAAATPAVASRILPVASAPVASMNSLFRFRPDRAATPGVATTTALVAIPTVSPLAGGVNAQAAAPVRPLLSDLVTQHMAVAPARTDDEQFDCLARTVYFESRGEPIEGQLAVAEVVLNRVRSGRFRDTVCGVVTQRAQFSFVRSGVIPEVPRDSTAWKRSVAIARIAVDKLASINGEQSLFFHATYVHPNFGRERIGTIGRHIFFR